MTGSDVHREILEISEKYINGKPPITIETLAEELKTSEEKLHIHLKHLATLGLISVVDDSVMITKSGRKARLP